MDQVPRLCGRRPTILDEITSYLIEDPLAPPDCVEVLLRGAQERVAQREGIQHASIEDDGRHYGSKIWAADDAAAYR